MNELTEFDILEPGVYFGDNSEPPGVHAAVSSEELSENAHGNAEFHIPDESEFQVIMMDIDLTCPPRRLI